MFVRAIAPVAGMMLLPWIKDFHFTNRPSILEIHGTHDPVTLWKGDYDGKEGWGAYLSQEDIIKYWAGGLCLEKYDKTETINTALKRKIVHHRCWTESDHTEFRLVEI